ncbi:UDP-glycosyltransferase 91C1-like [Pyrus ussuriensis x Pyrus communis]|uniref:UDP-glycosyltransferase 91C1-like n=1 Tax=Pyrus ussuriensis x Pyrus communis TaxID=2448454 RepID=A0A5N5HPM3_9ROSA|nr:UDP-glycosyltransferase 91C1-like [Pyrus ussuriensis x Pyrus communis]
MDNQNTQSGGKRVGGGGAALHVVVFPWLAMGHIIPFFRFSTLIAQKGHTVAFVSTPRNLSRLPRIPSHLSSLINLVSLPLPRLPNLPKDAESSADVPFHKQQLLKTAFDMLQPLLTAFLESSRPDWVIYDYTPHWLPATAARLGISRAFFCCFNAACMSYIGPPSLLVSGKDGRTKAEDFTVVPKWVPFESDMAYRLHEIAKWVERSSEDESVTPDTVRFGFTIEESDVVFIRSSEELEPEWLNLMRQLYRENTQSGHRSISMDNQNTQTALHVVVFPWLAMGHLIPFFHLSTLIAQKGHTVSFVSTPRNLSRLRKIPSHLSSLVNLVSFPLPRLPNLPNDAESSTDVPFHKQQLLKTAFDMLQTPLTAFLESSRPDWVIYDYAPHWLPAIAARLGVSHAFFCCVNAACLAYLGPPSVLISGQDGRTKAEDFTVVPKWVPFESDLAYRLHEIAKWVQASSGNESGTQDTVRFGVAIKESDVVFVRSSDEFEPEWLNLVRELYREVKVKPVVPVGFLPPNIEEEASEYDETWGGIKGWFDKQRVNSSGGTHRVGSRVGDVRGTLLLGVEKPARVDSISVGDASSRVCGTSQGSRCGLNARLGNGRGLGVEIPRNERDGSFTRDSVAEFVRLAVVDDSGESLRTRAKEMKDLFRDRNKNNRIVDEFICFLEENRPPRVTE